VQPRTTAILFVVAAALAAFVWFYEIGGEEGRREAEARQKRLFPDVESADVDWIQLHTTDGRDVKIERRDGAWQLVEPLQFPGDGFAVDSMASTLAEISSEAVYEDPQEATVYGLDDASREVRFGAGDREFALRTGDATPLGSNSYASVVGEKPVYTVPTFRVNALRKKLDDLRDKRILDFDVASVTGLTASWPDGRVVLARQDGQWRLEAPLQAEADADTVDDLLSDLSFLRAASFADDPPPDAETGLDEPAFRVELELAADGGAAKDEGATQGEGTAKDQAEAEGAAKGEEGAAAGEPRRLAFALGGAEVDGQRYVRAGRPTLFLVPAARLGDFPRKVAAYRFKQLTRFGSLEAKRLELVFHTESGGASESVTVHATRDGGEWSSEPEKLDPAKLRRMVEELSRLEAQDVLADEMGSDELRQLGLDPPELTIRVYGEATEEGGEEGEKPLAEVRIGALQGSKGIPAQRADRPTVFELDHALSEHVPVSLEALRNRFLAQEKAPAQGEADDAAQALAPGDAGVSQEPPAPQLAEPAEDSP
jgi:hypothetical protein